jgi:DNA-binding NarL/FixJ family response regulator
MRNRPVAIMMVDDSQEILDGARHRLAAKHPEWLLLIHSTAEAALADEHYLRGEVNVVVCDQNLEREDSDEEIEGLDVLIRMMRRHPKLFTILITSSRRLSIGPMALQWHVGDFIVKGETFWDDLVRAIEKGLRGDKGLTQAPRCFAIMPFGIAWLNDVYTQIWKPAATQAGYLIRRNDEFAAGNLLLPEISAALDHSEVALAELTDLRPNVLFEIGLACGKGKVVVLVAENGHEIPSDLSGVHQIRYDRGHNLWEQKLEGELVRALSHASQRLIRPLLSGD